MDNVDRDNEHSDPKADDTSTSTSGNKRKRDGVTKRGIVAMKKVIEARKNGIKIKELSAINSNNAKNRKCQYKRGALGYAQLTENIKSDLENQPPARQRMIIWKAARVGKDGNIVDEYVQRIVDEGDSIVETLTSEEMMCRGPNDILAKAIKKEYHERVFTAGSCITKKGYFGKRREISSDVELHRLKQVVLQMKKKLK